MLRAGTGASSSIPDSVESRYLYELMASNRFQEGLKNYRDLLQLNRNLDRWVESLGAFDDILDTRQRAYVQRLPNIDASLSSVDLPAMTARRVELESRLQAIERSEDVVALGTAKEQESWAHARRRWSRSSRCCRTTRRARRSARSIGSCAGCCSGTCGATTRRGCGPSARAWASSIGSCARRNAVIIKSRARATIGPRSSAALTARIEGLRPRVLGLRAVGAGRAASAARVPPGHRGRGAQGAARPAEHLHGASALRARVDLRPRGRDVAPAPATGPRRSRRAANDATPRCSCCSRSRRSGRSAAIAIATKPVETDGHDQGSRARRRRGRHAARRSSAAKRRRWRAIGCSSTSPPTTRCCKAEAMRRLADLQLETADVEELASNVESLGALGGTIRHVRAVARVVSELRQERSRALPARASVRGGRAHRRLARDARSAHRTSTRDTAHLDEAQFRRGETLFVQKRYRECRARLRGRDRGRRRARRSTSSRSTSTAGRCSSSSSTRTA